MYESMIGVFLNILFWLWVAVTVYSIGNMIWCVIDDKKWESGVDKALKVVHITIPKPTDIFLEIMAIGTGLVIVIVGAFAWPLTLLIICVMVARDYRRKQKEAKTDERD